MCDFHQIETQVYKLSEEGYKAVFKEYLRTCSLRPVLEKNQESKEEKARLFC